MKKEAAQQHVADRASLPAAGGVRGDPAAGAQGIDDRLCEHGRGARAQLEGKDGYTYGLHGTPTTFILEERIATLEGGVQTLLVPSGLSAVTLVDMALLKSGDEVLIPGNAYGPGQEFARNELAGWGIDHRFYDPLDPGSLEAAIGERTRLVSLEAPGSVTMEFPDLAALVKIAQGRGVTTALDNTWGTGIAFPPFAIGGVAGEGDDPVAVDISVQALTKYPVRRRRHPHGLGDDARRRVAPAHQDGAHARRLRRRRQRRRARAAVAAFAALALPGAIARGPVRSPSGGRPAGGRPRPSSRAAGIARTRAWRRLCSEAAGLFSVVFDERYTRAQVDAFVDALKLFRIGYSWAGPVSLVASYDLKAMRKRPRWPGFVVRFSVGLEAIEDLIADCEQALATLARD